MTDSSSDAAQCSDETLLQRIAGPRDTGAFVEFVGRHEHSASSLAYHITHNSDDASEVLQESLIRVWANASAFRGDGTPRAWFLRIVVRESIRLIKKRKRHAMRPLDETGSMPVVSFMETSEFNSVSEEVRQGLRNLVQALPETDRQILAMYFGGGMNQADLARTFEITQQAVSFRIKRILNELRAGLGAAGCAAALPLVSDSSLSALFQSGHSAPKDTATRALSRIRRMPVRPRTSMVSSATIAATAVLLCGAAWLVYSNQKAPVVPPSLATSAPPATPVPPATPPLTAPEAKLYRKWTFEKGLPPDLEPLNRVWSWRPASAKEPAAIIGEADRRLALRLTPKLKRLPVVVSLAARMKLRSESENYIGGTCVFWYDAKTNLQFRSMNANLVHMNKDIVIPSDVNYVFENYIVKELNGELVSIDEYPKQFNLSCLAVAAKNEDLEAIEIKEVDMAELPPELRDLPQLFKKMVRGPVYGETNPSVPVTLPAPR